MTKKEAIALGESRFYLSITSRQVAQFQLFEDKLCMPFAVYRQAVAETLDRKVGIHEFTTIGRRQMQMELTGELEGTELIPSDKKVRLRRR